MPKTEERSPQLSSAQYNGSLGEIVKALREQPKVGVFIPQPHGSRASETKYLNACISGVHFWLRYGKYLMVPRSVYLVLLSGIGSWVDGNPQPYVQPQSEDDVLYMPKTNQEPRFLEVIEGTDVQQFGRG